MKRILLPVLLIQLSCASMLHAKDYSLIDSLPAKLAAAKKEGHKLWDTGNDGSMKEGSYNFNNALAGLIKAMGAAYYQKGFVTSKQVDDYVKSLYTLYEFKQDAANPFGEFRGSMSGLDVVSSVSDDLEKTIAEMVQKITAHDSKFDYTAWKKKWDSAEKAGD